MNQFVGCLKKYATFSGRARRSEFWMFFLVSFLIGIGVGIVGSLLGIAVLLKLVYQLAILLPALAVGCRRLHDTGRSGWLQLLLLIPLIGFIVLVVFWVGDSKAGSNKYGENPKIAE